jgi:hypothetical protein
LVGVGNQEQHADFLFSRQLVAEASGDI